MKWTEEDTQIFAGLMAKQDKGDISKEEAELLDEMWQYKQKQEKQDPEGSKMMADGGKLSAFAKKNRRKTRRGRGKKK